MRIASGSFALIGALGIGFSATSQPRATASGPLAEIERTVPLDKYRGWANYERLRAHNVAAAYRNLLP